MMTFVYYRESHGQGGKVHDCALHDHETRVQISEFTALCCFLA